MILYHEGRGLILWSATFFRMVAAAVAAGGCEHNVPVDDTPAVHAAAVGAEREADAAECRGGGDDDDGDRRRAAAGGSRRWRREVGGGGGIHGFRSRSSRWYERASEVRGGRVVS